MNERPEALIEEKNETDSRTNPCRVGLNIVKDELVPRRVKREEVPDKSEK